MRSRISDCRKGFGLGDGCKLSLRADAFNVLNHAGRGDPVTDINNANFGRILSTMQRFDESKHN